VIVDGVESFRGLYTRAIFEVFDDVPLAVDSYNIDGESWGHSYYEYNNGDAINESLWLRYGVVVTVSSPDVFRYKARALLDENIDGINSACIRYRTQYGIWPSDEELYLWLKAGEPNDR
jgi:hypothetical protein